MKSMLEFIFYLLLLCGAVLLVFGLKLYSWDSPLILFPAMLGVGGAAALLVRRWGRVVLFIAIPAAIVVAALAGTKMHQPAMSAPLRPRVYVLNDSIAYDKNQQRSFVQQLNGNTRTMPGGTVLELFGGIKVELVASGLYGISALSFADSGCADADPFWDSVMYASVDADNLIYRLVPCAPDPGATGEPAIWQKNIVCSSVDKPMGMQWHSMALYVATRSGVVSLEFASEDGSCSAVKTVVEDLPLASATEHRAVDVDAHGNLFVSIAADSTRILQDDWRRAGVVKVTPGGEISLFAAGLNDCRALVRHPQSNSLWASDNSPESLGLYSAVDEINVLFNANDYGWPFCYAHRQPDPDMGSATICASTTPALAVLPPHSVPAGMAFGDSLRATQQFRSMLYVALHGRADDMQRQGFRILGVPLDEHGRILGWGVDIIRGWADGDSIHGTPGCLCAGPDGALYMSDAYSGRIYRFVFPRPGAHQE